MGLRELYRKGGPVQEGLSGNGSEGLGGHGEGFEVQGQGVTRRRPGEVPKADGGRSQAQEMDSYDQPQYEAKNEGLDPSLGEDFYESWNGLKDPEGFENQEHRGLTGDGSDITDEGDLHGMFGEAEESSELKKSSEKEKREHPWLSKKQAAQVARDHMELGEGPSLQEFFLMEARGRRVSYTLEPEANGRGRLLRWEAEPAGRGEDTSYEAVARGGVEELLARLAEEEPAAAGQADEIRRAWDEAVSSGGEAVWFGVEGGRPRVDIQAKAGREERWSEHRPDPWEDVDGGPDEGY